MLGVSPSPSASPADPPVPFLYPQPNKNMKYYLVRQGYELRDENGELLGAEGEIVGLETDSDNIMVKRRAEGLLKAAGGANAVTLADAPEKPKKTMKAAKKASYKTREMTPEDAQETEQ